MSKLNICFVLCPNMLATSATLPMEQLVAAASLAKTSKLRKSYPLLNLSMISLTGDGVKTHTGLCLQPDYSIAECPAADIVYLPALWRNPERILRDQAQLIPWLQQQHENNCLLAAVGTGCWFLAEAGLLDHKPATTHWYYFSQFQERYPQVQLKRDHFITQAGNIYCAGSVNAFADLTVYFIQSHFGPLIASHVERHFFHENRRLYETTRGGHALAQVHPDEDIVQAQTWLRENMNQEVSLAELANHFGMSTRTFNRRFKAATDTTPLNYLQAVRIETAKDLLKSSNLSVAEIVFRVGYQDAAYFTSLFKRKLGTTPSQYRVTVRAKMFSPD
ncbi:transcriptional regulator GlxA family with amidase domain [Alteromonadaceae bacterium 2753L.S.0a.02]|nr:transcriptional regulator GlxA family with amidase domain [Alteromonadaceae bacterium 2753L.S.0a.02]